MKNKLIKLAYALLMIVILSVNMSTVCADDVDNEENLEVNVKEEIANNAVEAASTNITEQPSINSRRCVVYDRISNTVIFGKDENVKAAMASTTKIMTATIVLENAKLSDEVIISEKAGGTGGSRLGLRKRR